MSSVRPVLLACAFILGGQCLRGDGAITEEASEFELTGWTVPRAFSDKTEGERFRFQLHRWGCYHDIQSTGWVEADGPRTWRIQGELVHNVFEGRPSRSEPFVLARTEEDMQFAMMGIASADFDAEPEFGYYIYGYNKLRFDWNHDGEWDVVYSWMGHADFPEAILTAFSTQPALQRVQVTND